MLARALALIAIFALPQIARAQELEVVPPPPAESERLSEEDQLLRWASNEVRIHEGREARPPRAPLPPTDYMLTSRTGPVELVGEGDRDALRVLAESGMGALGVALGGGIGALIVWGAMEGGANPDGQLIAMFAAAATGMLGVTSGVVLAGDLMEGRGNFGHAFVGQAIGVVLALPLVVLGMENDLLALPIVGLSVLPLAGAILAYEIAHADADAPMVYVSPIEQGAMGGVAGTMP
jgi:hypothetical protein